MDHRYFVNPPFGPHNGNLWWQQGLFTLLVVLVLVVGAVLLARQWRRRPATPPVLPQWHQSSAIDTLDARYARGEIDRDDYMQRRADILGHPMTAVPPAMPPAPSEPPAAAGDSAALP